MIGRISEVFDSIQGEGIYLGEKQLFVRFFGCNLNCQFCDTKTYGFTEYEPQDLLQEIRSFSDEYHSISFTGGEPLVQKDFLKEILALTKKENYKNYLETNGTLGDELADVIDYVDIVAMDLKLPTSTGNNTELWQEHRKFLKTASKKQVFLKSVVCWSTSEEDFCASISLIREINRSAVLVLQPNSFEKYDNLKEKLARFKDISLDNNITTCVIPQMHKVMGVR